MTIIISVQNPAEILILIILKNFRQNPQSCWGYLSNFLTLQISKLYQG